MNALPKRDWMVLFLVVGGAAAGLVRSLRSQVMWRPLGRPPAALVRLYAATRDTLLVEASEDGTDFAYRDEQSASHRGGAPEGQWTSQLPSITAWAYTECDSQYALRPSQKKTPRERRRRIAHIGSLGRHAGIRGQTARSRIGLRARLTAIGPDADSACKKRITFSIFRCKVSGRFRWFK